MKCTSSSCFIGTWCLWHKLAYDIDFNIFFSFHWLQIKDNIASQFSNKCLSVLFFPRTCHLQVSVIFWEPMSSSQQQFLPIRTWWRWHFGFKVHWVRGPVKTVMGVYFLIEKKWIASAKPTLPYIEYQFYAPSAFILTPSHFHFDCSYEILPTDTAVLMGTIELLK